MNVVVTQSMLFPWVGMLEQMRLSDVFVHYDDVQFSKGSFTNRVQVKTQNGSRWMTIPLQNFRFGLSIDQVEVQSIHKWRKLHLNLLAESFRGAPYASDAMGLAENIYSQSYESLGGIARASMMALADYYRLLDGKRVLDVRDLGLAGSSSKRVLDVVRAVNGTTYITGLGAQNYLDHQAFEFANVDVQYMKYKLIKYNQRWGDFTPYVTGLDLVANCGASGIDMISSVSINWRELV